MDGTLLPSLRVYQNQADGRLCHDKVYQQRGLRWWASQHGKSRNIPFDLGELVLAQRKTFAPFNNLKNDFTFSARFGKKQENVASLPFNCCTFYNQVGLLMLNIASHLSGFASMPL